MYDYRHSFKEAGNASEYQTRYSKKTLSSFLFELEKIFISYILRDINKKDNISYLDFACGTGRIISFIDNIGAFDSTGIDISEEMLKIAKSNTNARLLCKDISISDSVEGKYDLITAFRFFLHPNYELRSKILSAINYRMRDGESLFILNNHGNRYSFLYPVYIFNLVRSFFGGKFVGTYLTNKDLSNSLKKHGFKIDKIIGFGFMPGFLIKILPFKLSIRIELFLNKYCPFLDKFGINQIFVCKKVE